jgi:hypothetical protein
MGLVGRVSLMGQVRRAGSSGRCTLAVPDYATPVIHKAHQTHLTYPNPLDLPDLPDLFDPARAACHAVRLIRLNGECTRG